MESSEAAAMRQLVDRLQVSYPDVAPERLTSVVRHQYARFDGRPVRDFVPLFVERSARRELASSRG